MCVCVRENLYKRGYVCTCVCVCVCERERERECVYMYEMSTILCERLCVCIPHC